MQDIKYSTGCSPSPRDIRTFILGAEFYDVIKGGKRYDPQDIEDQSKVGICTGISDTQKARKATGIKYSADFQYLCQKKYYDKNWTEGSSIFNSLKVAKNIGFLPESEWTFTTQEDRKHPYGEYIKKLQVVSESELGRLILIANQYKIKAYASVPVTRDSLARAIDNSRSGILARYVCGNSWWIPPIEPLRNSKVAISGHAAIISNFNGNSFRIANTWGDDWADHGTAYHLFNDYSPTEAWAVWYKEDEVPAEILQKLDSRDTIYGKIIDLIQQLVSLILLLKTSLVK